MKKYLLYIVALTVFSSCNKDYFEDTGVHEQTYPGSALKYLKDHPTHFSLLTRVIAHAGMESMFDQEEITFFAPQNVSISNTMVSLNSSMRFVGRDTIVDVEEIKPAIWKKYLELYVVNGKYELKDIAQVDTTTFAFEGKSLVSRNGRIMNAGVMYHTANNVPYAGYRMVIYSYIRDFADSRRSRINIPVSSSNIKPYNAVVHVLRAKDHSFGFDGYSFIEDVVNGGLLNDK